MAPTAVLYWKQYSCCRKTKYYKKSGGKSYRITAGPFTGHDLTRGSGQEGFKMSRDGSGQEVLETSRVGSVQVDKFSNIAGRVGSGEDVFKYHGSDRVGSRGFQILTSIQSSTAKPNRPHTRTYAGTSIQSSAAKRTGHTLVCRLQQKQYLVHGSI